MFIIIVTIYLKYNIFCVFCFCLRLEKNLPTFKNYIKMDYYHWAQFVLSEVSGFRSYVTHSEFKKTMQLGEKERENEREKNALIMKP